MANKKIYTAWLTVNRECNNRCPWCYARETNFTGGMNLETAMQLIDLFSDLKVREVILMGGEPTLYPHFSEVIEKLINAKIKPALITNGRKFSDIEFSRRVIDTGLTSIGISVKGANREQYKELTKSDGFDEMMLGYKNLKSLGIEVSFSVTIVSKLLETLPELLNNIVKTGVSHISFDLGTPVIIGNKISVEGIPDPLEGARAITGVHNFLKNTSVKYSFYVTVPLCLFAEDIKNELIEGELITTSCHIPRGEGVIFTQDGSVLLCNHFTSCPFGKYGIDFTTTDEFIGFWNNPRVESFRKICHRYPSKKCINCRDWDKCGGGCMVKWLYWKPDDFIK